MTRKRRMFDIELPDEIETGLVPEKVLRRRGPMAAAISENAEALQARKAASESIRAENDALAHEYVALREAGHVVRSVPLDEVRSQMLVRDRMPGEDAELAELVTSIREVGLSNPIRVIERPGGGYELVQGFRRLSAFRQLQSDGQGGFDAIPALIVPGEPDVAGLYRRMVDENVIRKDLSFAEMAHAARNYLNDPDTDAADIGEAVAALFQSAPYSKRNYIRNFAFLLDEIGTALRFPTAIPRALGVTLARALKDQPGLGAEITGALAGAAPDSAEAEQALLRGFVEGGEAEGQGAAPNLRKTRGPAQRSKTTFHIESTVGQVKCTAGAGRLEIKVDRDFSSIDRARLERAIADLVDGLG